MLSAIVFDCFLRGALIGLIFGVPIGVIGVMTIQRTIEHSPLCGLATGMSSAFVDFVYGFIAIYGLSMVSDILLQWKTSIRLGGCALILLFGIYILMKGQKAKEKDNFTHDERRTSAIMCFITTLPIALSNPVTIISFTAGFASIGIVKMDFVHAFLTAVGIFTGASVWWILLVLLLIKLRSKIKGQVRMWLNRIAGLLLIVIGIFIAFNTLSDLTL